MVSFETIHDVIIKREADKKRKKVSEYGKADTKTGSVRKGGGTG